MDPQGHTMTLIRMRQRQARACQTAEAADVADAPLLTLYI